MTVSIKGCVTGAVRVWGARAVVVSHLARHTPGLQLE